MKNTTIILSAILILLGLSTSSISLASDKFNELVWENTDQGDWYEWWYYKVIDPKTNQAFYFTYGLVNPWDKSQSNPASKAFVSAGSFDQKLIVEEKFSPQQFATTKDESSFLFQIGNRNQMSNQHLVGDIVDKDGHRVQWDITTEKEWRYNAMGWTLFFPEMSNIYWYPAQANMKMSGWIKFDGRLISLEQAPAYQDRNWGRSFPKWWAWIVSNKFKNSPGTVLASGGGTPKVLNAATIQGYTIGLLHEGKEHTFRMPDGDKINLNVSFGRWEITAYNIKRLEKIVIHADAPKEKFMVLPFTTPQGQVFKDYEALQGHLTVQLYKKKWPLGEYHLVADLESDEAGIEFGSYNDFDLKQIFSGKTELISF